MNEFIRVFRKRNVFLLIILVVLNTGLFMLSFNTEKEITLTGEELKNYINGYEDYYENVKQSSRSMLSLNMYKTGFASDNIRKTAELYETSAPSEVKYGDNTGTVLFIQYNLSDIFLLAFMAVITADMFSERRKGLVKAVRSTVFGRGRLYVRRILILAFSSVLITVLLYGADFTALIIKYGIADMNRSIQALPEFMQCPFDITISDYLISMLLLKAFAAFTATALFFLFLSLFDSGITYTVSVVAAVTEFLFFKFIPPVSSFNHLRYINLITAFSPDKYCCEVFFLNIFGNAVPVITVLIIFMISISVVTATAGYFIHERMYVSEKNGSRGIAERISKLTEKLRIQRSLTGWETYKILFKQGGIFFLTASFVLALSSAARYNYVYRTNYREAEWYEKYAGEITEQRMAEAEDDKEKLERQISFFENRAAKLEQSEYTESVGRQYSQVMSNLTNARERYAAFTNVYENMSGGYEYFKKTGNKVDLIKPYSYELLLCRDNASKNRASLFILIGITGALSGVFAYDRQNNMKNTLRSSYRGRGELVISKMVPVILICTVSCIAVHMIQFVQIGKFMGYNDISVPVQSLPFMRDFGSYISIAQYFVLMFAVRALFTCVTGILCAIVSRLCPDTSSAMGISVFIFTVPYFMSQMILGADLINAVYLIGGAGI